MRCCASLASRPRPRQYLRGYNREPSRNTKDAGTQDLIIKGFGRVRALVCIECDTGSEDYGRNTGFKENPLFPYLAVEQAGKLVAAVVVIVELEARQTRAGAQRRVIPLSPKGYEEAAVLQFDRRCGLLSPWVEILTPLEP